MRSNSFGFSETASLWADSFGAYSACSALRASLVSAPTRLKNTEAVRDRMSPDSSSGRIVFSNVAGSGLLAIASTSFRCSAMPRSNAGPKWLSLFWSNRGECSGSWVSGKNGLLASAVTAVSAGGLASDWAHAAALVVRAMASAMARGCLIGQEPGRREPGAYRNRVFGHHDESHGRAGG